LLFCQFLRRHTEIDGKIARGLIRVGQSDAQKWTKTGNVGACEPRLDAASPFDLLFQQTNISGSRKRSINTMEGYQTVRSDGKFS
jgi:hypothetical protein